MKKTELERKRLYKSAMRLLDRADFLLNDIYASCKKATDKKEADKKAA